MLFTFRRLEVRRGPILQPQGLEGRSSSEAVGTGGAYASNCLS